MANIKHANATAFLLQLFADEGAEGNSGNDDAQKDGGNQGDKDDEKKEPKYTDDDLDRLFARKYAEWNQKQEKKQHEKEESERLKNMNAEEKRDHEYKQMRAELDALKKEKSRSEMAKIARGMLADKNINVGDALVANLICDAAEDTKDAVDAFVTEFDKAVQKAVAEKLKGKSPAGSSQGKKLTKADIMKIENRQERQKLIQENIDLFR